MEMGSTRRIGNEKVSSDVEEFSQWREDLCIICCGKCFISNNIDTSNKGKIQTSKLLSLLETSIENVPEVITVCVPCALLVGKLQTFQEEIFRIQSSLKCVRDEILTKIRQSSDYSAKHYSNSDSIVRSSLCTRWKIGVEPKEDTLNPHSPNLPSKIPAPIDVVNNSASPALEELSQEDEDSMEKMDIHEIQFHLDPKDFEDIDIKFNESLSTDVECIDVADTDDEEEIDTATLIPAIEISTFSESEQGSSEFSTSRWDDVDNGDVSTNPLCEDMKEILPQESDGDFFYSSGNEFNSAVNNRLYKEPSIPVGLPALSPVYKTRDGTRSKVPKKDRIPKKGKSNPRNPVFSCTVCTETFRSRDKFKEHLEIHNGKAPTCMLCQKVFPRKHNLMIHMRTHTGEKPYDCPVCHKPYSDRSNFNAHVKKHMDKPFACTICGRMFDKSQAAHVHATSMHPEEAAGKIISKVTFKS